MRSHIALVVVAASMLLLGSVFGKATVVVYLRSQGEEAYLIKYHGKPVKRSPPPRCTDWTDRNCRLV